MSDDTKLILVYRAGNSIEGNFLKGLLNEHGIPVTVQASSSSDTAPPGDVPSHSGDQNAGTLLRPDPLASGGAEPDTSGHTETTEFEIHVPADHLDSARAVLRQYEGQVDGEPEALSDWECHRCGEENEASFDECWNCQAKP